MAQRRGRIPHPTTKSLFLTGFLTQDSEQGMGQQGKRDMPIPPRPATDLMLIQATFALGNLKTPLDLPALARNAHQSVQRDTGA